MPWTLSSMLCIECVCVLHIDSLKALTRLMQDEQGRRQLLKMEHLSTIILEGLRHPEPVVRKCTAQLLGRLLQLLREAVTDERDELLAHLITVVVWCIVMLPID